MKTIHLIFPHHLFHQGALITADADCFLIEADLFFTQYPFHQQKIAFHRASMQAYAKQIAAQVQSVTYIEAHDNQADVRHLIPYLATLGVTAVKHHDCIDDWLGQRLQRSCEQAGIKQEVLTHPGFLTDMADLKAFFRPDKSSYLHHQFYQQQRKRLNVLVDEQHKPTGGQWSFDADNRKKYPKNQQPPAIESIPITTEHQAAVDYVQQHFSHHLGTPPNLTAESALLTPSNEPARQQLIYPINHQQAQQWLTDFLQQRFIDFGRYEDAMVADQLILHHSLLTPMLNVGLLTPQQIIEAALSHAEQHDTPINSLEGFVRQIIGWREFIRGLYVCVGSQQRTTNFWQFKRRIPDSFYTGDTGIEPLDTTIRKVLDTGYCHHIERLMVLGNFMLLCEFDPDAVYQWFMELFIDAYDWVMVPNVYGMSQFADGGLMATKPYISSSNYLLKMSDFKRGDWQTTWDGLFWRFMHQQRDFFASNPRIGMLLKTWDRMGKEKQQAHLTAAQNYLDQLDAVTT